MGAIQVVAESRQQEVRNELARLLGSAAFRSSKRCREFLHHVVEKTVNGEHGSLKERTIGTELFHLPHDFDTSQHTIVRVTASETRKKLAQYYHSECESNHGLRIDLPTGSYSAEFSWVEAPSVPPEALKAPEQVSRRWLIGGGAAGLALSGVTAWRWRAPEPSAARASTLPVATFPPHSEALSGAVRIGIGASTPYQDRNGKAWGVDRFFSGGVVHRRPAERIARTLDPDLYRRLRLGDFRYDLPLVSGVYEMHLHFAETGLSDFISAESSGEGQRVFRVALNGKTILDFFDVVADAAGANIADERVFRDISPGPDGHLHLVFSPQRGSAMLSGIELLPVEAGKVSPIRIRSGWPTSWRDASGREWRADSYFLGGNALVRRTNPARDSEPAAPDNALYTSERWGHFSYALPVADGKYRVTLKFCEGHLGPRNTGVGGVGGRVFDVYCNGVALMKEFDIVKEAGGEGRPIDRVFSGIRPNAQGKVLLTFVPIKGMACVNAIEVAES
jgi:hypothetical protein